MIDPVMDHKYNIILSIFLGALLIVILNQLFNKPVVAFVYKK